MGEIADTLGNEREVAGMRFHRPTMRDMGDFELWLEDEARQETLRWKDLLPTMEYLAGIEATKTMITRGTYSWSTEPDTQCGSKLETDSGKCRLLWIVTSRKKAVKLEDVTQAFKDFYEEFEELLQWMLASVPNSKSPAGATGTSTQAP